MIGAARDASKRAYAPYSHLRVGAALMAAGKMHIGCNVENSSFGLTICAERAAVFAAVAAGHRTRSGPRPIRTPNGASGSRRGGSFKVRGEWSTLVIYTPDSGPLSPCGACRQVLAEFCRELPIISVGRGGRRREFNLRDLLPQAFAWPAGNDAGG
jgi:cytidine deaminase